MAERDPGYGDEWDDLCADHPHIWVKVSRRKWYWPFKVTIYWACTRCWDTLPDEGGYPSV